MPERQSPRRTGRGLLPEFAEATWASLLAEHYEPVERFDPSTVDGLPPPAQRLLRRSLPQGTPLSTLVELDMDGEIKLGGRWMPFTARQLLRAGTGFVWAPRVGGRVLRFTGADTLSPSGARIEFRLHGRIPVVRGSSDDVRHSAQGRLAAETVAWLPQALTPQAGAGWAGVDDHCAIVTLDDIDVEVTVDDEGHLLRLGLQRWRDSANPPVYAPFGGSVDAVVTAPNRVSVAGRGTVGWGWNTPGESDGVFFHYRIIDLRFVDQRSNGMQEAIR